MAASSEATPVSPDVDKTVSDKVAASAAEAVERLQRAAETIAADVRKAETAPSARPLSALASRLGLGVYEAVQWRRAAAASLLCAGVAVAAVLGLRDGGRPNASHIASAEKAIQAKQVEDERKLQDMQGRLAGLSDEVKDLHARLDKQSAELRAAQARVATAATSAAQASSAASQMGARIDKVERDIAGRIDKVDRDSGARIEQHTTRIERMERLVSDPVVTSSIPKSTTNPPAALKTPANGKGTEGFVLRGVHNGVATVQTGRGLIEVGPGDTIPGVGRVRAVQKVDGRWVVVLRDGVIDAD